MKTVKEIKPKAEMEEKKEEDMTNEETNKTEPAQESEVDKRIDEIEEKLNALISKMAECETKEKAHADEIKKLKSALVEPVKHTAEPEPKADKPMWQVVAEMPEGAEKVAFVKAHAGEILKSSLN